MSDDISIPPPGYYTPHRPSGWLDAGTLRTVIIAGGLILGGGAAWLGISHFTHHGADVPVIQADTRPVRVKPENPGGLQVAGVNNDLFMGGGENGASKLAPAPEAPDLRGLRTVPPPAPAMQAPAVQAPPVVLPAPAPVTPQVAAVPTSVAPAPKPIMRTAQTTPQTTPQPLPQPQPQPLPHGQTATAKPPSIQLAALNSEAAARQEWQVLQKRLPGLLAGHTPAITKIERDGKTYWRLRTAGFADAAAAKSLCAKVRDKGASCAVVNL